jgi:hypothetical protein
LQDLFNIVTEYNLPTLGDRQSFGKRKAIFIDEEVKANDDELYPPSQQKFAKKQRTKETSAKTGGEEQTVCVLRLKHSVDNVFVNNISSVSYIPKDILNLLNKGIKYNFCLPVSIQNINEEWERATAKALEAAESEDSKAKLSVFIESTRFRLLNYVNKSLRDNKYNKYKNLIKKCLKFLSDNKLIVREADKNLGLTIMDLSWYDNQVVKHLSDDTTYKLQTVDQRIILRDLYAKRDNAFRNGLRNAPNLYREWIILDKVYNVPEFYIIPKLHKNPYKSRPIVPSHSWITSAASKWLDEFLKPIVYGYDWCLKDTAKLLNDLENTTFSGRPVFVTADVESMYTNIDQGECLRKFQAFFSQHFYGDVDKLKLADFAIRVLEWVLNHNFMQYKGKTFRQVKGIAMGTPCAPMTANLFLIFHEKLIKKKGILPERYYRFLDDVLAIVDSSYEACEFLDAFGECSTSIFITRNISYIEANFTDLNLRAVYQGNNVWRIRTKTYDKPQNMHLYSHPDSYYPEHVRIGWIQGEHIRHIRNCSTFDAYEEAIARFRYFLARRNFTNEDIDNWLSRNSYLERPLLLQGKCHLQQDDQTVANKSKPWVVLRNIPGRHFIERILKLATRSWALVDKSAPSIQWGVYRGYNLKKIAEKQNKVLLKELRAENSERMDNLP